MIREGIARLVQGNTSVSSIAKSGGFGTVPKDQALPTWSYMLFSRDRNAGLVSVSGLSRIRMQIDCYGQGADVINLASAINGVLHGFTGTLPDSDSTWVNSCLQTDEQDMPQDPESRSDRTMLEYEIWYAD